MYTFLTDGLNFFSLSIYDRNSPSQINFAKHSMQQNYESGSRLTWTLILSKRCQHQNNKTLTMEDGGKTALTS
jgi:hypothetical protein